MRGSLSHVILMSSDAFLAHERSAGKNGLAGPDLPAAAVPEWTTDGQAHGIGRISAPSVAPLHRRGLG